MTDQDRITIETAKAHAEADVLLSRLARLSSLLVADGRGRDGLDMAAAVRRLRLLSRTLEGLAGVEDDPHVPGLVSGPMAVREWMKGGED